MSFMDKAKDAALEAKRKAADAAEQVRPHSQEGEGMQAKDGIQEFKTQMKAAGKWGKSSLSTLVEKIDPSVLAHLIIKATAAQEKANIALRAKGSPYRIAEITITASIPPQIGFAVTRLGDMEEQLEAIDTHSSRLVEEGSADLDTAVVSLEGEVVPTDITN